MQKFQLRLKPIFIKKIKELRLSQYLNYCT